MEVLLIHPRFDRIETREGISLHYKKSLPPIDLGYIAQILRSRGHGVRIEDAHLEARGGSDPFWKETRCDAVVICTNSLDNWQCPFPGVRPVTEIMANLACKRVVVYGPQVTEEPSLILDRFPEAICVRGEPEWIVARTIDALAANEPLDAVPAISYRTGDRLASNPVDPRVLSEPLPSPAYDLMQMRRYRLELFPGPTSMIESGRGCPFGCGFCLRNLYPRKFRRRPIEQVVEELEILRRDHGIIHHYFIDLEFTLDARFTESLLHAIIARKLGIEFIVQTRCDQVDAGMLRLLRAAGCKVIMYGVESGDQELLDATGKDISLSRIRSAFRLTRRAGIKTLGFFLLGLPGETGKDIRKTIRFAKELDPDYASFVLTLNYPGTRTHRQLRLAGIDGILSNMALAPARLESLRRMAVREFYLRPRWLARKLLAIGSWDDVKILYSGFRNAFLPLVTGNTSFSKGKDSVPPG